MRKAIERFVEYPVYANLIIAVVILAGGLSLTTLKKSFFPETEISEEERLLKGFKWLDKIRPKTKKDIFRNP